RVHDRGAKRESFPWTHQLALGPHLEPFGEPYLGTPRFADGAPGGGLGGRRRRLRRNALEHARPAHARRAVLPSNHELVLPGLVERDASVRRRDGRHERGLTRIARWRLAHRSPAPRTARVRRAPETGILLPTLGGREGAPQPLEMELTLTHRDRHARGWLLPAARTWTACRAPVTDVPDRAKRRRRPTAREPLVGARVVRAQHEQQSERGNANAFPWTAWRATGARTCTH